MGWLFAVVRGSGTSVVGGSSFDTSEYRQATYGAPTHYCDPTLSVASPSGSGTFEDPWNITRAMANAVAGNVVGFKEGVSAILTSTDDDNLPTMRPANSGTAGSRIVFVTRYAAVALANVDTNALRTQIRHNGTAEVAATAPGPETGSAAYGVNGTDYITFDGFYVDMASAEPKSDSGVIHYESCTGFHCRNWVVKGKTTNMHSNPVILRPTADTDSVIHNFKAYGFHNPQVSGATQEGLFSDFYGSQNYLLEYGEISDTDSGPYPKGTAAGVFNYGHIRYLKIHDLAQGMRFNDFDTNDLTEVDHNLIYDYTGPGMRLSAETSQPRQLLFHHNTIANGAATAGGSMGPITFASPITSFTSVTFRDNILDWAHATDGRAVEAVEHSESAWPTMNYNGYYRGGNNIQWSANGDDTIDSIEEWRTLTSQEANSVELATEWANNRASDDYTIAPGHAALTASSTGGELGCYEGDITPGPYGSYGF
jgi:hypothetical protein